MSFQIGCKKKYSSRGQKIFENVVNEMKASSIKNKKKQEKNSDHFTYNVTLIYNRELQIISVQFSIFDLFLNKTYCNWKIEFKSFVTSNGVLS